MPKRTSKKFDVVQNAQRVVLESIGEGQEITASRALVSQVMAAMGRKGGKIGGKRRLETMTPEQRQKINKLAAQKRWANKKKEKK